jgi:hypothetical protein
MGWVTVPKIDDKWTKRKGLEGPFNFSGRVLYYDAREGKYYDPQSDFYVEQDEMDIINQYMVNLLKGPAVRIRRN